MERTIKITTAIETPDAIEVSYDVYEGEKIVATGAEKFSHKSTKESIEEHLQYILEKRAYETVATEDVVEVSPAATITAITGLEVKPKKNDNEK